MENRISRLVSEYSRLILPLLLAVVLVSAILSIYGVHIISVWNTVSVLICCLSFALCEYVNTRKKHGSLYIILALAVSVLLFNNITAEVGYGRGFLQWILTDEAEDKKTFLMALLAAFPFFFSATIYYMTNVIYRMGYLTLLSLIPCVIYVKIASEIDNVYLVLIALINIGIYIFRNYTLNAEKGRVIGGRNAIVSAVGFVFAILTVVAVIPKEEEAKYYDRFEEVFMNGNIGLSVGESFSKLGDTSGNADNYKDMNNRRLYNVYGENVPYLKRQNFDYYDFNKDNWYSDSELKKSAYTPEEWYERSVNLNLTALQAAMGEAEKYSPGFAAEYGLEDIINANTIRDSLNSIYIQATEFKAIYYLASARCVSVNVRMAEDMYYATRSGTFRSRKKEHQTNIVYQMNTYDEFDAVKKWIELGGSNFDKDEAHSMLYDLNKILEENNSPFATVANEYMQLNWEARSYAGRCEDNTGQISTRLKQLANKLTKDCTYDWEKAEALQNYFHDNDFVYDMEYTAEDTSPEYFLFKSKTGTCSDFASAYVLLARAAGLTVRYTEGYAPEATAEEKLYTIADSDSHAYPEVFIQNIGWLVYEPTISSEYNDFADEESNSFFDFSELKLDTGLLSVIMYMAVIALFALIFIKLVIPAVQESLFMRKIKSASPAWCILLVYKRIAGKTAVKLTGDNSCRTPYELAVCLESKTGINIYSFVFKVESTVYGGIMPTELDKTRTIDGYIKLKKEIKEFNKKIKKGKN